MKIKHILRTDWLRRAPFSRLKPRTKDELNEVKSAPAGAVGATNGLLTANMIANGNGIGATFISAALSGIASMLTGGNFANGAVTAAFVTLFNDLMHPPQSASAARLTESQKESLTKNILKAIENSYRANGPDFWEDENGTRMSKMSPVDLAEGLPVGIVVDEKLDLQFGDVTIAGVRVNFTTANNISGNSIVNFETTKEYSKLYRINFENINNKDGRSFGFMMFNSKRDFEYIMRIIYGTKQ